MNLVQAMILKRVEVLLEELSAIGEEIIDEGQRKSKSTAVVDLMSQRELSPELLKRMGVVNIQLTLLQGMAGNLEDGK